MTMAIAHFKLSKLNDLTRRVSFPTLPTWSVLAAKIQSLYSIPLEYIAVSYIDSDGDEVTLSSEEELRDFYYSTAKDPQTVFKFTVLDLSSLRAPQDEDKPLPATPRDSSTRNTFASGGAPAYPDVEDSWQHLGLGGIYRPPEIDRLRDNLHAFVEVVDSDGDISSRSVVSGPRAHSDGSSFSITASAIGDKGKESDIARRATVEDDFSSSASVLDDETSTKHPVHVAMHGLRGFGSGTFGSQSSHPTTPVPEPSLSSARSVASEITATHQDIDSEAHHVSNVETDKLVSDTSLRDTDPPPVQHTEDPPLPDFDDAPYSAPSASLSNDIATLLNTLSTVFSSHPEVTDSLRTLLHNASNGAYWNAHRESVAQVAEDIRRATQQVQDAAASSVQAAHRQAEEEAGRRVTEALGNVFRAFGEVTARARNLVQPSFETLGSVPPPSFNTSNFQRSNTTMPPPPVVDDSFNGVPFAAASPSVVPTSVPPPIVTSGWHPIHRGVPITALSPGTMPPPGSFSPPGPPPTASYVPAWSQFRPYPQTPVDIPGGQNVHSPGAPAQSADVSYYGASPRTKPKAAELKASLEAAKQNYKAEKERYRRERGARKKELERRLYGSPDSSPLSGPKDLLSGASESTERQGGPRAPEAAPPRLSTPDAQIISNARGKYPQLEIVSFPHSPRKQRISGPHAFTRGVDGRGSDEHGAYKQVIGRLLDMGFSEKIYPSLPNVLQARLSAKKQRPSKDEEDELVSDVIDELLAVPADQSPPKASGSGIKKNI